MDNSNTIIDYINLSDDYLVQGDFDKSVEYAEKAVEISEKVFGRDNPNTVRAFVAAASSYIKVGRIDETRKYIRTALDICQRYSVTSHPMYASALQIAGKVYSVLGEYDLSESYFDEAIAIYESFGDLRNSAYTILLLGEMYCDNLKYEQASVAYNDAWNVLSGYYESEVIYHNIFHYRLEKLYNLAEVNGEGAWTWINEWTDLVNQFGKTVTAVIIGV